MRFFCKGSFLNLRQSTRGFSLQHAVFPSISLKHLKWGSFARAVSSIIYGNLQKGFHCNIQSFPQSVHNSLNEVFGKGSFLNILRQSVRGFSLQHAVFPSISLQHLKWGFSARAVSSIIHSNLWKGFHCNKQFFPQSIYITLNEVFLQGQFPHPIYSNLWEGFHCKK